MVTFPVNTTYLYNLCTMLDQRRRRWADVVQMLCKCFVFAGLRRWPNMKQLLVQTIHSMKVMIATP